jgi:hypothetical protein
VAVDRTDDRPGAVGPRLLDGLPEAARRWLARAIAPGTPLRRAAVFRAVMDGPEATYDGFTVPLGCRAGWWHCPDGCAEEEFIRFALDDADYR